MPKGARCLGEFKVHCLITTLSGVALLHPDFGDTRTLRKHTMADLPNYSDRVELLEMWLRGVLQSTMLFAFFPQGTSAF